MSNLLSNAPLFKAEGEFDYIATPVFYSTSLEIRPPLNIIRFKDQSFTYLQPGKPTYVWPSTSSVSLFFQSYVSGKTNGTLKAEHSLRVI